MTSKYFASVGGCAASEALGLIKVCEVHFVRVRLMSCIVPCLVFKNTGKLFSVCRQVYLGDRFSI